MVRAQLKTSARGYGSEHQRERARWAPIVAAGEASCAEAICLMPILAADLEPAEQDCDGLEDPDGEAA